MWARLRSLVRRYPPAKQALERPLPATEHLPATITAATRGRLRVEEIMRQTAERRPNPLERGLLPPRRTALPRAPLKERTNGHS